MLYNYVHNMLKLSTKLGTNKIANFYKSLPIMMLAMGFAVTAPILEKVDLVIIPIALIIINVIAYYVSKNLGETFKQSLCPMMFEE